MVSTKTWVAVPEEVWVNIFFAAMDGKSVNPARQVRGPLWILLHVCGRWRRIVLAYQGLWARIRIVVPEEFADSKSQLSAIDDVLRRSGQHQLGLDIRNPTFAPCRETWARILTSQQRCVTLRLNTIPTISVAQLLPSWGSLRSLELAFRYTNLTPSTETIDLTELHSLQNYTERGARYLRTKVRLPLRTLRSIEIFMAQSPTHCILGYAPALTHLSVESNTYMVLTDADFRWEGSAGPEESMFPSVEQLFLRNAECLLAWIKNRSLIKLGVNAPNQLPRAELTSSYLSHLVEVLHGSRDHLQVLELSGEVGLQHDGVRDAVHRLKKIHTLNLGIVVTPSLVSRDMLLFNLGLLLWRDALTMMEDLEAGTRCRTLRKLGFECQVGSRVDDIDELRTRFLDSNLPAGLLKILKRTCRTRPRCETQLTAVFDLGGSNTFSQRYGLSEGTVVEI